MQRWEWRKKQIIRTLFFETMLVNIFSLILGFLLGVFLLVILAKIASEFFMANYFVVCFSLIASLSSY